MSKIRINFTSGSCRYPLIYLEHSRNGDVYIPLLPSSKSGLHMSFHKDFFISGKVHIADNYGFDEWAKINIKPDINEVNELKSYLNKWAYNPEHGEDVLVLSCPVNYEGCIQQVSTKNVNLDINMNKLMTGFSQLSLAQVPIKILPKYFQASPLNDHVIIDETTNSFAIHSKRDGISLNFSIETSTFEKQFESMPFFKDIMQPMNKAMNYTNELVSQKRIPEFQIFPKEFEFNQFLPKIKIKKFS